MAYLADKHHSGNRIRNRHPNTYTATLLGTSRLEARKLVTRGKNTVAPPTLTDIRKDLATLEEENKTINPSEETAQHRATRLSKERHRFHEATKIQATQQETQHTAAQTLRNNHIPETYLRILDRELSRLHTGLSRHTIRTHTLSQAAHMPTTDVQHLAHDLVATDNKHHADPQAAATKRYLTISAPDTDGRARLTGYLPATTLALIQETPSSCTQPDKTTSGKQPRTLGQRHLDKLTHILHNHASPTTHNRGGTDSIVVSMTTQELTNILGENNKHRLTELLSTPRPTNTAPHHQPY